MDDKPHVFHNLLLSSRFYTSTKLYRLVTQVQVCEQICPTLLHNRTQHVVEPTTSSF